mgnify:CR=1 FL=1
MGSDFSKSMTFESEPKDKSKLFYLHHPLFWIGMILTFMILLWFLFGGSKTNTHHIHYVASSSSGAPNSIRSGGGLQHLYVPAPNTV